MKEERNREIVRKRKAGATFVSLAKEFDLSKTMVSLIVRKEERLTERWGDSRPKRGVVRTILRVSGERLECFDEDYREGLLAAAATITCDHLRDARKVGKVTRGHVLDWLSEESGSMACGCPGVCKIERSELKMKIEVFREKEMYFRERAFALEKKLMAL